jgi:putative DNA primase/helicase
VNDLTIALSAEHRRELLESSAIDSDVVAERGYTTVARPGAALKDEYGRDTRDRLRDMGFPSWATREDYYYPGLLIPQYTPTGLRYAGQFKPFRAVPNREGKPQRYASAKGPARLDVHPRWSRDRGGMQLPVIQDPTERLWITEGVKKADSLTSRGACTVALTGVYNWRNTHATLGDWEDIRLRGREIVICFDADAITKAPVAQAMGRLGKWLRHKGAAKVWYLTVPPMCEGAAVKGVDDWFAAGGTLKALEQALQTSPPQVTDTEDRFTDARLAEVLANEALDGQYVWAAGLEWLAYAGNVWAEVHEAVPLETVRQWSLERFGEAVARMRLDDPKASAEVDGWRGLLSRSRAAGVLSYAKGIMQHDPAEFDGDADHINTPSGYLNLDTGVARPLGEGEYPTRITGARFDPDATAEVWDTFLARILPDPEVRAFVQRLFGYALLGEVREHVMPIFTGSGANGKGTIRDAVLAAFGTYGLEVDPEILMVSHNPGHKTFLMELKGRRLIFCSETDRNRRFNEPMMKRLSGGDPIQANKMRMDPITFLPSHLLVMCTNHLPKLAGDDEANWRRVLVVPFDVVIPEAERNGRLPGRLKEPDVQAAVLAWVYEGYRAYVKEGLNPPEAVRVRTAAYRADSDTLTRFMDERTVTSPAGRVTASDLYSAYEIWHRTEYGGDEKPIGRAEVGKILSLRGVEAAKSNGVRIYRGLCLVTDETS